jgi:hypothetical protein
MSIPAVSTSNTAHLIGANTQKAVPKHRFSGFACQDSKFPASRQRYPLNI